MREDNSHLQTPATIQLVLQKRFEEGLGKQQISNVFANQDALRIANITPLTAIDTFSDARNGKQQKKHVVSRYKDPAKRTALVDEYVKAMKTVQQGES